MYDFFWSHALVSDEAIDRIHKHCDFSPNTTTSKQCDEARGDADDSIESLDIYNIYAPLCFSSNLTTPPKRASVRRLNSIFMLDYLIDQIASMY